MRCRDLTALLALLLAGLLATASVSAQSAYDPQVAYTQEAGRTFHLYLANADGSHAVRVASVTGPIAGVDFAPGGGRIAFADQQGLKVLSYVASNAGIAVTGIQTLVSGRHGGPDFSPDGTRLLYYSCSPCGFRVVPASGGAPQLIFQSTGDWPHWLRAELGDAFAFMKAVAGPVVHYEIWTVLINGDGTVTAGPVLSTATQAFGAIEDFDIAHTRNALLLSVGYPTVNRMIDFDLGTGAITNHGVPGFRVHYSADDSRIVFRTLPGAKGGEYIDSLNIATGVVSHLTARKGSYGVTDARP
jgi:hypothetical protein